MGAPMNIGDTVTIGANTGTVSAISDSLVWLELEKGGRIAYRLDALDAPADKPKRKPRTDKPLTDVERVAADEPTAPEAE